jgi:thiaminase/transcriptional activator TenA
MSIITGTRFTEKLKASSGEQWNRVVTHRFTKELAAGTIDREVLKKYLVQDHRFLDDFVVLLASIVANARSLSDRIPACQFLALITAKENTYFERCFESMNCSSEERKTIPDAACTTGFCNLMRQVAQNGTLGEMLSVIVVCEWTYMSWADLVKDLTVREDFTTYEWVDLHSGPEFEGVVSYLRQLLDTEGNMIDDAEKEKCKARFLQAMQLEEDFFDFAYT